MRQTKVHQLRAIFRSLPGFAASDPRARTSWRLFKKTYLSQPRPTRFAFLNEMRYQAAQLKETTQPVTTP